MTATALDNPVWASLAGPHRDVAMGRGGVLRYPRTYAPFLGVAGAEVDAEVALASLVSAGETVLLVGVAPKLSAAWRLERIETLAQMTCENPAPDVGGPAIVPLDEAQCAQVLALVARVYPHYFRPHTMDLGHYFGIYREGRLAAMIGERMATAAHTEMSAICTHPDFTGRRYASRLTAFLVNGTLAHGRVPFLHVSHGNPHAVALYERLGFRIRAELPFWSLRRA